MVLPTKEQRVRILVHHAWDLRDAGQDDASIIEQIIREGVPPEIAHAVPGLIDDGMQRQVHDSSARDKILADVRAAVGEEDFDALREAMLVGVDDERTLHKMSQVLEELLVSDSHEQGTVAAYGLSFLVGLGDWPLLQALSHSDENVRYRAAFALGKMGKAAANALEPLKIAMHDEDDYVKMAAEESVAAIERAMKPWWKFW
ncbi:MAG: HEAT repeat domain-containing protein [Pirellulales bacterium]